MFWCSIQPGVYVPYVILCYYVPHVGLFSMFTGSSLLTRRVLSPGEVLGNMTGHAMWQSFVNQTEDDKQQSEPEKKSANQQLQVQIYLKAELS